MRRFTQNVLLVALTVSVACPGISFAFGAIAIDDSRGKGQLKFGLAVGYKTAGEASKAALGKCSANGGTKCLVMANFERCGAVSTSDKSFGIGWGIMGKRARIMSLRNCGDDNCTVVDNACEDYGD
jgi:hypothetical protein